MLSSMFSLAALPALTPRLSPRRDQHLVFLKFGGDDAILVAFKAQGAKASNCQSSLNRRFVTFD
jgi:hypothetical protein